MPPLARRALSLLVVAALYALAVRLTLATSLTSGAVAAWPPAGLALVLLVRGGLGLWPGVVLGAFAAKAFDPGGAGVALAGAVGPGVEAVLGAAAVRRLGLSGRSRLVDLGSIAQMAAGVLVSAVLGVTARWAAGVMIGPDWITSTVRWALGDGAGIVLVAPLALLMPRARSGLRLWPALEGAGAAAAAVGLALVIFSSQEGQPWLIALPGVWIITRCGLRTAATAAVGVAVVAIVRTAGGHGPLAFGGADDVLRAQLFAIVLSGVLLTFTAMAEERRRLFDALRHMADDDAALRRVATAVAAGAGVEALAAHVSREVARLLDVDTGAVLVFEDGGATVRSIGRHVSPGVPLDGVAPSYRVEPGGVVAAVRDSRRPARLNERDAPQPFMPPFIQRVAAPVIVDGSVWGVLVANTSAGRDLPADAEERLGRFAELVGLAIANASVQARLEAQATTDPLTGLLNHRAFHERLREEVAVARRQGRPLSLAVFDLDRFKQVNDALGHVAGDTVLREAAQRLAAAARTGESVARIGGDELAVLLPGVAGPDAHAAAERLRRTVCAEPLGAAGTMTMSAGVCDLEQAQDGPALLRLADGALYWAKGHGRDACIAYSPEVVEELSAQERAERLEQARTLAALGALARAIDAKDTATTRHSERVAALAQQLALTSGWSEAQAHRLHDAALVHDVGKIGVPDAVLSKPARLTAEEYEVVRRHADLGAQIVAGVLEADQVAWVRGHHERHDGRGYPDGLADEAISPGARLLALADAWDAMTAARVYSTPMSLEQALEEVRRNDGAQFHPDAVAALEALHARRALGAALDATAAA